jgi:DNA-binding NarL/FixJ family response regulator
VPSVDRVGRTRGKGHLGVIEEAIDVVLLDLNMPNGESGGLAMVEILDMLPRPMVIVVSGECDNKLLKDYGYYGFDGRVKKPFSFDVLWAEIRRVLALQTAGR